PRRPSQDGVRGLRCAADDRAGPRRGRAHARTSPVARCAHLARHRLTTGVGEAMPGQSRPVLVFAWDQFGPYHMDRLEALAEHLAGRCDIVGIELVSRGEIYGWKPTGPGQRFRKITLFPDRERSDVSAWRHLT